jgi:hypothetical protein
MGNAARVDAINGTSGGAIGGAPFQTIQQAITAINNASATGITIWILPGTYNLTSGITIPPNTAMRGLNIQTCTIQMLNVNADTTLITMGSPSRLEDLTLKLTSQGHYTLKGLVFGGTTTTDAKLRTCVLTVDNSGASSGGTSNVYGVECNGSGTLGPSSFSFNSFKASTINVYSNGGGNKRGILVSSSNIVTSRDLNVYVAQPVSTASTGSYVGVETDDAANTGSIQLRSTTIGTVSPRIGESYTASDILQTTPSTVSDPTYLSSPGIQIGPGTDLVTKTAGGKGFSTFVYPSTLYYGLRGNISSGTPGFLWPGTQSITSGVFPDPSGMVENVAVNVTNIGAGNNITVGSITGLAVGMPIVFSATGGNISGGIVYYINSFTSVSTLKISATQYGGIKTLTNIGTVSWTATIYVTINTIATSVDASNAVYVTSTTNLSGGMPITFASSFGNLIAGSRYFVGSVGSGYITLKDAPAGSIVTTGVYTPSSPIGVTALTTTTQVSATEAAGNAGRITVGSTAGLAPGMPIIFASSFNNVIAGTLYYIYSIDSATKIFITSSYGGSIFTTTAANGLSVNAYIYTISNPPAFYRVQQPAILSGIACALANPASVSGGTDSVTISVYRTPAGSDVQTGIAKIPYYTQTFDGSSGISLEYYDTSQNLAVGDRISVFMWSSPNTPAHDLSVQLDMF